MIPDKIRIGGYDVEVKMVDNLVNDRQHLGEYFPRTQEIHIDQAQTKQSMQETFIHEIIEAIKSIYDLEMEHSVLTLLSTCLHQVLRDNKIDFYQAR